MEYILRFLRDESGPTTVEYALLLAIIVLAVTGAILSVGTSIGSTMQDIINTFSFKGV